MRPLGNCPELVHLPNSSSSNSVSKQLPVSLWTTKLGNQQFRFVAVRTEANITRCGPYIKIVFEKKLLDIYSFKSISTNWQTPLTRLTHTIWVWFLTSCLYVCLFSAQSIRLKEIQLLPQTKWPPVGTKCLKWTTRKKATGEKKPRVYKMGTF